jgi:hypothetical protein
MQPRSHPIDDSRSTWRITTVRAALSVLATLLRALGYGCVAMIALTSAPMAIGASPVSISAAVADFDNLDTAGEDSDRTAAHAARVSAFAGIIGDRLAASDKFEIVPLTCPASPCSPSTIPAAKFIQAARDSGARLVIYGGIQKMSTLVQIGVVQAVDLKTDKVVLNQYLTFRGDSDESFRRAATFVTDYLKKMSFDP